jgi:hypothetical protein
MTKPVPVRSAPVIAGGTTPRLTIIPAARAAAPTCHISTLCGRRIKGSEFKKT